MRFTNVSILGLAHLDAPHRVTSAELDVRLAPALERLGVRPGLLEATAGIVARRFWDEGVMPSTVATQAAELAISRAGIDRERIGVVMNTSVCRDYIEPSTACLVHGNLGLPASCLNFDVGNACLAFLNGIEIAGLMLESGQIDYALVVDGEGSRFVTEQTLERMLDPACDAASFRSQFAALTLGSGAAAMVLGRSSDHANGHRYLGGVTLAASEHNRLCVGHTDRMDTDTRTLLFAGVELAGRTWQRAHEELGWSAEALDELVLHQVSRVHTDTLAATLGLDDAKILRVYPEFGNIGPAGVPYVLSKAVEAGRVTSGARVALMGIGSGLNCAMSEVVW
ncbi:MAG: 3-oxoacyl-ACP synthase III [Myxococcales bacterium]|nr:3-oxoacyl-ACP synthase III [Myxococcales bacterium]MCB9530885.1 3-oxoacyl-ACP synthase III [Myxococcales bacterium]MCB9534341.1 3-oxoacyl-ACP synthase III [Myxococcales bacterium]